MKILIDCLGGDKAPEEIVKGIVLAKKERKDVEFTLVGPKDSIESIIMHNSGLVSDFEIIDAKYNVTNDDKPISVIRDKKDSSLGQCLQLLSSNSDYDAILSAASTGAILTGSIFKVGRLDGVLRPCMLATMPTRGKNQLVRIMDVGANMDSKPEYLYQYAVMGNEYLKILGIEKPRIRLLSVGMEDEKGNSLVHETFPLLKNDPELNFLGNIEGDHVLKGDADLVITDGFAGNIFLKTVEDSASFVKDGFMNAIKHNIFTKICALPMLKYLNQVKAIFAYAQKACSPFLGIKKLVVKMHGKADCLTAKSCALETISYLENHLIETLSNAISKVSIEDK